MTNRTHPVLEGPLVFLSVPTPSLRDQLKLKDKLLEITLNYLVSSRQGNALLYLNTRKKYSKVDRKAAR